MFGTQQAPGAFGQQPSSTGAFGQPSGFGVASGQQPTSGTFGAPSSGGFGGFKPATTSFGSQPTTFPFGTTTPAPASGVFGGAAAPGFGGTAAPAQSAPGFGTQLQPTGTGGFSFGAQSQPATAASGGFGGTPSTFGTTTSQPLFGTTTAQPVAQFGTSATKPSTGLFRGNNAAFGASQAPTAPFGAQPLPTPATLFGAAPSASLLGSTVQQPTQATTGPSNLGTLPTTFTAPTLGTAPSAASTNLPTSGIAAKPSLFGAEAPKTLAAPSFGTTAPSATAASSTVAKPDSTPAFSFTAPASTTAATTESKPAISFKLPDTATTGATTTSGADASKTTITPTTKADQKPATATTAAATTSTTTATAAPIPLQSLPSSVSFPSNLKNKTLEEIITNWNEELENLVASFEKQAVEIAQWDKKIVHNGEQIIALNDRVNNLEAFQKEIDQSLSYVVSQQSELEGLLDGIEKELPGLVQAVTGGRQSAVDVERDRMYESTEVVQKQVIDVANQLSRMIHEINTAASEPTVVPGSEGEGQPLVEIAQVLNAHLDALQWIDHKVEELWQASSTVKGQASKASAEMERFSNTSTL